MTDRNVHYAIERATIKNLIDQCDAHGLSGAADCIENLAAEVERLRRQLNPARAAIAAVEQDHSGGATDMAADLERLRPMDDEVQAARHVMREHNRLLSELAASQAREQQLRDDLGAIAAGGIRIPAREYAMHALAAPQDTSALESLIARAGEVMRERCAHEADPFELKNALATDIAKGIRALPGVKLEDLK